MREHLLSSRYEEISGNKQPESIRGRYGLAKTNPKRAHLSPKSVLPDTFPMTVTPPAGQSPYVTLTRTESKRLAKEARKNARVLAGPTWTENVASINHNVYAVSALILIGGLFAIGVFLGIDMYDDRVLTFNERGTELVCIIWLELLIAGNIAWIIWLINRSASRATSRREALLRAKYSAPPANPYVIR